MATAFMIKQMQTRDSSKEKKVVLLIRYAIHFFPPVLDLLMTIYFALYLSIASPNITLS